MASTSSCSCSAALQQPPARNKGKGREEKPRPVAMAAVDLSKLVKEKRFWVASFLVAWAAALQGHMMWIQRQDAFKHKFGLDEADGPDAEDSSSSSTSS